MPYMDAMGNVWEAPINTECVPKIFWDVLFRAISAQIDI